MARKRSCPAGFDKAKHSPATGKRYKKQMCVSRSRPLRVVPPNALMKRTATKRKARATASACPSGYESATFSPATGKKYRKAMCVDRTARGGKIRVIPKSKRRRKKR